MSLRTILTSWTEWQERLSLPDTTAWLSIAFASALAFSIFVIDTFTPLDIAIAVMYVLPVLLSANFCGRIGILIWGISCIGLTLVSFLATHASNADEGMIGRVLVSILAISATTLLAMRIRIVSDAERSAEEKLHETRLALARVTRIVTLGELMASIAHEVNQPLASIVTNGEACIRWLGREVPSLEEARDAVKHIISDGRRAGNVIEKLRALSQREQLQKAPLNINAVISGALALIQRELLNHGVSLHLSLASDLPAVAGDRVHLQQVVINLAINAAQAMDNVEGRPRKLYIRSELTGPGVVRVSVRDCGIGIGPQNLGRLFDAFFTTKSEGLGMGLSISRSIIEAHGGRIWVLNNDDCGATFGFDLKREDDGA